MEGVPISNAIIVLDRKLETAQHCFYEVRLKLRHEKVSVDWSKEQVNNFQKVYHREVKSLTDQINKIASSMNHTEISSYNFNLWTIRRLFGISKRLLDIVDEQLHFHETHLQDKQHNLNVFQIFSDHIVLLREAQQARAKTNPPLTEEEIENLQVPDFLWELNNLYPPHSQTIMDEYDSQVFSSKVKQLTLEFKEIEKYYGKKRPRPEEVTENDT